MESILDGIRQIAGKVCLTMIMKQWEILRPIVRTMSQERSAFSGRFNHVRRIKTPTVPDKVQKGPTRIVSVLTNARLDVVFYVFAV